MMQGKIVLVTGATNGIGKIAALELARKGAHVIVAGRSADKTNAVVREIQAAVPSAQVEFLLADLSLAAGVHDLADQFLAAHDRLDVLLNNAGAMFWEREETAEGHEMTFALNHLNYFLLTHRLLGALNTAASQTGDARIVNVSSDAHRGATLDFDDLESKRKYNGFGVYSRSKLMNVMFTYALARRLAGTGVTTNALHPGAVATGFGRNNKGLVNMGIRLLSPLMKSPEKGAQTSIYLASSPDVKDTSGQYFSDSKPARSSEVSYAEAAQEQLWQISENITQVSAATTV